ncbi:hypothetical protein BDZ85DRAFT_18664 [Elsinoe ampelina]|uniref:Uncharacterized protein n=1 Tax=Elsinoe ampelina TaxID=302913 RepID=A0A6A6G7F3_9PEZI|nr:hypothetical protein BDZ85DRAFT_18664 [Elsinoe ampelina]
MNSHSWESSRSTTPDEVEIAGHKHSFRDWDPSKSLSEVAEDYMKTRDYTTPVLTLADIHAMKRTAEEKKVEEQIAAKRKVAQDQILDQTELTAATTKVPRAKRAKQATLPGATRYNLRPRRAETIESGTTVNHQKAPKRARAAAAKATKTGKRKVPNTSKAAPLERKGPLNKKATRRSRSG